MASLTERSSGSFLFILVVGLFIGALDRVTKIAVCALMQVGQSIKVIPHIFHITLIQNTGSAFGLFREGRFFFIAASLCAIVFILWYSWTHNVGMGIFSLALGFVLAGAAGNLIDRIRFGYVIDFLDFRVWPVFNVADSAITVGVGILAFEILFSRFKTQGSGDK